MTNELRRVEHDAFSAGEWSVDVWAGVAGALVSAGPIAVGLALDQPHAGLNAGLGALNVALGTPLAGRADQTRWGAFSVVACTLAAATAAVVHPSIPALLLATLIVTAAGAELRRYGEHGAVGGFVVTATFIIVAGLPSAQPATELALQFLMGGLFALAVMTIMRVLQSTRTRVAESTEPGRSARSAPPIEASPVAADENSLLAHAGRVSVAVTFATAIYRSFDVAFGYWIPLSTLAVLQPEPHCSWVKSLQRSAGTLIGAAIVAVVIATGMGPWSVTVLVAISGFTLFALRERSYFWFVVAITPTALLMIATANPEGWDIALHRILNTAIGLAIALVVSAGLLGWTKLRTPTVTRRA